MKDKIINILEENRLYDDKPDLIETNKISEFLDKYKINKSSNNPFTSTIKRNKDGFLVLDNEPFIVSDLKTDGHNEAFWILLSNGSRILTKEVDYNQMSNELLFEALSKKLNIPNAKYDIGILNNEIYLLSQSFCSLNDTIFDYYKVKNKSSVNIEKLLKDAIKINQVNYIKKILIIDKLTDNKDRFPNNIKTIIRNNNQYICPLFDNGACGIGTYEKNNFVLPIYNNSSDFNIILEYLLEDEDFKNWIIKNILNIYDYKFNKEILNEKHIFVDYNMNTIFSKNINDGIKIINKKIKT